ncbi:MAG: FecR domain-containing protein [Pseudomonadota bacterium]|nr:FecR domain-containing protein [Pseudomonadota bacterium]
MNIGKQPFDNEPFDNDRFDKDYLWDRSGPVDAEVAALERLLSPYGVCEQPAVDDTVVVAAPAVVKPPRAHSRRPWRRLVALAAMVSGVAIGTYGWYWQRLQWPTAHGWPAAIVQGEATLDGRAMGSSQSLSPGSVLETGARGVAKLQVARIGEVVLGRDSRLRLDATRSGQHRVQLERGTLWARIWAPPGAFGVGVPSGEALDLGCEFTIRTDARGDGHLQVQSGWVQFDNAFAEVLVPQGAQVALYAEGPGTPHANDAAPAFVAALAAIDRAAMLGTAGPVAADADSVRRIVALSRREDAITLLSLLKRYPQLRESPVFDRLTELLPAGVTREALAAHGADALNPWWRALPYPPMKRWWMKWPDAISSTGNAQSHLRYDPP